MSETQHTAAGRILIADNDKLFYTSLAALLERHDYECVCAPDARAVLDALVGSPFDVFISDIQMPGNTGLELVESVSEVAEGLPVILLTGHPCVETAVRSVQLRVTGYLVKPPSFDELLALVQKSVTFRRHQCLMAESREVLRQWDEKLGQFICTFRNDLRPDDSAPFNNYLRVHVRGLLLQLAHLDDLLRGWGQNGEYSARKRELDLIAGLRQAIAVLAQTKQDFKSTKLGDLRKQLESLLASM